jgi:peptidoglycan/LPS O-acetylase OafA/YrhL
LHLKPSAEQPYSPLIRPFYPALDGLRAIAFLMVFAVHYLPPAVWHNPLTPWGFAGVDLFFVLSGFLITGILFDSLHAKHYFTNFYLRRSLRIFPLFYGFWLIALIATPFVHIVWNRYNLAAPVYLANFFYPGFVAGHHPNPWALLYISKRHPGHLQILEQRTQWSLCVEEQFYLLWPAAIFLLRKRRALLTLCLSMLVGVPFAACLYLHFFPHLAALSAPYDNMWTEPVVLFAGAALALWLRGPAPSPHTLRRVAVAAIVGSTGVLTIAWRRELLHPLSLQADPVLRTVGFPLIALVSAGLLLLSLSYPPLMRFLELRPLIFVGRISYGLYLFHGVPASYICSRIEATHSFAGKCLWEVSALGGLIFFAWCSFRFYESPFLRLKQRFAPRQGAISDPPANPSFLSTLLPIAADSSRSNR